jgi:hypothetical protein
MAQKTIDIALESTSQEILEKIAETGLGASAQTKKFTNIVSGYLSTTAISITGTGKVTFLCDQTSYRPKMNVVLDGVALQEFTLGGGSNGGVPMAEFYFESSVEFTASGSNVNNTKYVVQT